MIESFLQGVIGNENKGILGSQNQTEQEGI